MYIAMYQKQEITKEQIDNLSTSTSNQAYEAWFKCNVEAGLHDILEGRVVTDEDAQREVDALYKKLSEKV